MGADEADVRTVAAATLPAGWEAVLAPVADGAARVVVERDGTPVAALISAADYRRLLRAEAREAEGLRILRQSQAAFADVPDDELEREVDKAVMEARAELRRERGAREQA